MWNSAFLERLPVLLPAAAAAAAADEIVEVEMFLADPGIGSGMGLWGSAAANVPVTPQRDGFSRIALGEFVEGRRSSRGVAVLAAHRVAGRHHL